MKAFVSLICSLVLLSLVSNGDAADSPSPAASMMRLLQSGKVPESRLSTIVKLIASRGNGDDLAYLLSEAVKEDHWPDDLRLETLTALREAASTRKVIPTGDLSSLNSLLTSGDAPLQLAALKLAGEWKVASATDALREIVTAEVTPENIRKVAVEALGRIDPQATKALLIEMLGPDQPFAAKSLAVSSLTTIDVSAAAEAAADVLKKADAQADPEPILTAFLNVQTGSDVLAKQLEGHPPSADMAKKLLREMFSVGRTDPPLSKVLSKIAGIGEDPAPPTKEEIAAIGQTAMEQGDPARGEQVFRRNDLSCMKCHAVNKGGGQIGPDLSAIGASSPVEYLVGSVLDPDQAIKEAYVTKLILTVEGRIHQGIVADRTADSLVLKDAKGELISIPIDDIDDEVEGKSLMPKGLVKFMTQAEMYDLIKFLSMLGKPGEYAVRSTQRMQRWRVLKNVPETLIQEVPSLSTYEDLVLRSDSWIAAYSQVNGHLPLAPLVEETGFPVLYIRGQLNVSAAGDAVIQLNSVEGTTVWLDDQQLEGAEKRTVQLSPGMHNIVLRIDTDQRTEDSIQLEVLRSEGSKAEFVVVDGQ